MPSQRIQFQEWTPDQPDTATLIDAKNVFPAAVGYAPFPTADEYSNAASENLNNFIVGKFGDDINVFAGGTTKLFQLDSASLDLDDVSKSGGYTSSHTWQFIQYGSVILGANGNSKIQAWTLGTSTAFADVSADAPIATYLAVVKDFVVGTHIGGVNNKIAWSDINDETNWTSGTTSQADYQILPDGGDLVGISGGEFGLVFLEKAIYRMTYVGSPLFFQFDAISRGLGCLEGSSIAQYGATTYFLADDGFYSCDGQSVVGIGTEKVDRFFFDDVSLSDLETISTAVDPIKNLVIWNYKNTSGNRALLIYNWQLQKWSRGITIADTIGTIATLTTGLDDLDTLYPSLDAMTISLDDRVFVGGKFLFAGLRADKLVTFTGQNTSAELITPDIEVGYNSVITLVRPQIQDGTANIQIASRRIQGENVQFGSTVSSDDEDRVSVRSAGRYHRIKVIPTGNWTQALAIDVEVKPQGGR